LLAGVSFGAPLGAITALAGGVPGAGSLLFRMLAGLEGLDAGAVLVFGQDISRALPRERRRLQRRLAVAFGGHDNALFASSTVAENVAVAVAAAGRVGRRGAGALVDGALAQVGLEHAAHALPDALTVGERKRLALARALALRSPLLLVDAFDEGVDELEVATMAAIVRADRLRNAGAAVLVIGDAQRASDVADVVVVL
jgi:ABC-type transporter Mla maintaining outer membrane lipid asymmetry ATPase subunit MlaF